MQQFHGYGLLSSKGPVGSASHLGSKAEFGRVVRWRCYVHAADPGGFAPSLPPWLPTPPSRASRLWPAACSNSYLPRCWQQQTMCSSIQPKHQPRQCPCAYTHLVHLVYPSSGPWPLACGLWYLLAMDQTKKQKDYCPTKVCHLTPPRHQHQLIKEPCSAHEAQGYCPLSVTLLAMSTQHINMPFSSLPTLSSCFSRLQPPARIDHTHVLV